jgi:hypothetical protein
MTADWLGSLRPGFDESDLEASTRKPAGNGGSSGAGTDNHDIRPLSLPHDAPFSSTEAPSHAEILGL